jgi:hypothetical protein
MRTIGGFKAGDKSPFRVVIGDPSSSHWSSQDLVDRR